MTDTGEFGISYNLLKNGRNLFYEYASVRLIYKYIETNNKEYKDIYIYIYIYIYLLFITIMF